MAKKNKIREDGKKRRARRKEEEEEEAVNNIMTMPTQEATTSVHLLNKKRSTRISAASSDSVQSLKAQVKRLEKQREFLTLWKADVLNGFNLEASYVDVKLQACDGTPVFAHKAVLVSFFFFCLYLPAFSLVVIISLVRLYSVRFVCAIPTALRANPCGDTI